MPTVFPASNYPSAEFSLSPLPEGERRATGTQRGWCSRRLDFMKIYRYPGTRARRQKTVRGEEKARYRLASRGEVGAGWMTVLQDAGRNEEKL